jgi:hypothetical protein
MILKLKTGLGNLCMGSRERNGATIRLQKRKKILKKSVLNYTRKKKGKIETAIQESN